MQYQSYENVKTQPKRKIRKGLKKSVYKYNSQLKGNKSPEVKKKES